MKNCAVVLAILAIFCACKKNNPSSPAAQNGSFYIKSITVNDSVSSSNTYTGVTDNPIIKITFSMPVDTTSVGPGISLGGQTAYIPLVHSFVAGDSVVIIRPSVSLAYLSYYLLKVAASIKSAQSTVLQSAWTVNLYTQLDTANKYPVISDSALLTLVQQQTFKYFWDFGDPNSGMARERNTSGETVTTGGSGFGVMAILVGIQRNFITRAEGLTRITQIVDFLTTKAQRYHGAFSHWMNGTTGATIPFSPNDDGADIVETSYMMEGLLCARQYFNGADAAETALSDSINSIWNGIDWNWFRNGGQNVLYWNWSPDKGGFVVNVQVQGWDEALITYVLAASSNTNAIPIAVYANGWARNGSMVNGNAYYGLQLPLGPPYGGPLFFEHYSFMGINPNMLTDAYASYSTQTTNHSLINYNYCIVNPKHYYGYSANCWGLTASDENNGYSAHAPDNDDGVISPTAAISSLPYTPAQSMNALRFFYYKLGDKIWGAYGFTDAFNLTQLWFASSYLAIDQGPEIVMIENYRSGMMWNLFMSCPEVKKGMLRLGFSSPYL